MSSSNNAINNQVGAPISGVTNTLTITNQSNTASSAARVLITVGGASAGDPSINWNINSTTDWEMGIDNSQSDRLVISPNTSLGTSDYWRLSTSGLRTLPAQPAFKANLNTPVSNVTGDGTPFVVICNNVDFDIASNYDNTTGQFTAPVSAIYEFTWTYLFTNISSSHTVLQSFFYVNGTLTGFQSNTTGNAYRTSANEAGFNVNIHFEATAGDTLGFAVEVTGASKTVGLSEATFSGNLLF